MTSNNHSDSISYMKNIYVVYNRCTGELHNAYPTRRAANRYIRQVIKLDYYWAYDLRIKRLAFFE